MEFDNYAESYDSSFMGKGSGRFYADLIKELDIKDGETVFLMLDVERVMYLRLSVNKRK